VRMSISDYSSRLAIDVKALNDLKRETRSNAPGAHREVARQFEALFLQSVLKSMRDATPREGLFDSEQSRLFESMHDQQLTQLMVARGRGTGLAALIEQQLDRLSGNRAETETLQNLPLLPATRAWPLPQQAAPLPLPTPASAGLSPQPVEPVRAGQFVERVWPHAVEASRATGIPAHFMVAQAALETGWGRAQPRLADGSPSYNLFGIKAGSRWSGPVVEATTTEVVAGQPQRQVARFRAYASYAEAFRDYAELMGTARYGSVRGAQDAAGFARGLQQAGYASDPAYAEKLLSLIASPVLRNAAAIG
jgi:flagellar protein FlgJ